MHISRGFDGGIHAIGALVICKYIYLNTQSFPKFMNWVAFQEVQQMEQAVLFL